MKQLWVTEGCEQSVCNKLDVLCHELIIHSDQITGERIADKFSLSGHCTFDNLVNNGIGKLVLQHAVQQASKLCMQAFITRNQLVGKCKTRMSPRFLSQ